jgi:hypothetical protein
MVKQKSRASKKKAMFEKVILIDGPEFWTIVYKCKTDFAIGTTMGAVYVGEKNKRIPVLQTSLITVIGDL